MDYWELDMAPAESAVEALKSGKPTISVDERASRRWFFHLVDWPEGGRAFASHSIIACCEEIRRRGFKECNLVSPAYTSHVYRLRLSQTDKPK